MSYANIRDPDLLGPIVGARCIEITQQDAEELVESGSRVYLHFENGITLWFPITSEGFGINNPSKDEDHEN